MAIMSQHRYFILYKPINMVSQFVSSHDVRLLGSIDFNFPEGTHAIGRLDKDSEGLLLLTTNSKVTKLLFQGKVPHKRTYLVQVINKISEEIISKIANGISISAPDDSAYFTTPCEVKIADPSYYNIEDKNVRLHKNVTNSWITITLTEGKFHQVRKMVAAVGHKCLRLIRVSIEDIALDDLQPGEIKEVEHEYFFEKLKL
jgi:23S rRNA pseudouridine2457 synthase